MPQLNFSHLELVALVSDADTSDTPWPVADAEQWSWLVLNGHANPDMIGAVMYELALQNEVGVNHPPERILADIADIEIDVLTLAGGVRVLADDGTELVPGEGCGLEDWRDWLTYQSDDFDVWMGEHPAPYVEKLADGTLRVWQAWMKDAASPDALFVDIPRDAVMPALHRLDSDLRDFRQRLREWIEPLDRDLAARVTETFDEAF